MHVVAPTTFAPAFGINVSGKTQQFFEGFEITTNVNGTYPSLGFLDVPVLIGANGSSGAGGGTAPGIVAQYMTFNAASVGFGAPIGGNSNYIFAVVRFSNFVGNNVGIYGPLSDQVIIGNDFSSNGGFGTLGSTGGMVIGPQEGAPGPSGAARIESNRFEFNREGLVVQSGYLINMTNNQFDGNSACGLDLRGFWGNVTSTGDWFRGNGNNGGSFTGNATAGEDAHICFGGTVASSGSISSGGFYASNPMFITNYGEGYTNPIGTPFANTPLYALDMTTTASINNHISIDGGSAPFGVDAGNNAAVTDFAIFRNGQPSDYKVNTRGEATQGQLVNGQFAAQARGFHPTTSQPMMYRRCNSLWTLSFRLCVDSSKLTVLSHCYGHGYGCGANLLRN